MNHINAAIDSVIESVEFGVALASAQRELRTEAASGAQHSALSNMLHACADGLPAHPTPARLCERNHDRPSLAIEAAMADDASAWPSGMTATQIHLAALAFERAAHLIRSGATGGLRAALVASLEQGK